MPSRISQIMQNGAMNQPQQTSNDVLLQQLRTIGNQLRATQNPQAFLQSLLLNNPNLQQAMQLIKTNGDPEKVMIAMAQQRGIDPNEILKALQ